MSPLLLAVNAIAILIAGTVLGRMMWSVRD